MGRLLLLLLLGLFWLTIVQLCRSQKCPGKATTKCGCSITAPADIGGGLSILPPIGGGGGGGGSVQLWIGGIVFYTIDRSFSPAYRDLILSVLKLTEAQIGAGHLEFKEALTKSGELCRKHYVRFQPIQENECKATLGMSLTGPSNVSLNPAFCTEAFVIQHEVLHALGRIHEHSRGDRSKYLDLLGDNINSAECDSFKLDSADPAFILGYDYDSIMHYDSCAGSCNGNYAMTKPDGKPIGINKNMSSLDVKKLRFMYTDGQKVTYNPDRLCRSSNYTEEPVVIVVEKEPAPTTPRSAAGAEAWQWTAMVMCTLVAMATSQ